jgi:hypothetical protein
MNLRENFLLPSWTPETNRVPWGLMTPKEQAAMKAAKHGWETWDEYGWIGCTAEPIWFTDFTYRALPAPAVKPPVDPAIKQIFQEANALVSSVSELSGMEPHKIWKDRHASQFKGRAIVMWILYQNKNYSLSKIGSVFSRDHTSVLNAIRRVNGWRLNNINFVKLCEVIEEKAEMLTMFEIEK